jgi:SPP1 gp7 family putative phage head morphogenesis protein
MANINDKIKRDVISDSVRLIGLETQLKKDALDKLKKLERKLVKEFKATKLLTTVKRQKQQAILRDLLADSKRLINDAYMAVAMDSIVDLSELARITEAQTVKSFNKRLGTEITKPRMSKQMFKAIASNTLIEGAPSKEWWKRKSEGYQTKFKDVVRKGMMAGQTTDEVVSALVGTKVNKFKDGAMYSQYRGAEALVRTSIQSVANKARRDTYKDNDDIVKGIQWSATFDDRTSDICMALDGLQWTNDLVPIGHGTPYLGDTAHFNCRSSTFAIMKSWKELGAKGKFKEIPVSTRASMDGQVSGKLNYEGWLKTKDSAFQKEVLGAGKHKLWKEGKLGFKDMVSGSGKPLTLEQLARKVK